MVEFDANGAFATPQLIAATQEKIMKEGLRPVAIRMASNQWKKLEGLFGHLEPNHIINFTNVHVFGGFAAQVQNDKVMPDNEIRFVDVNDEVIGRLIGIER
jgi:hypothetical protein